MILGRVDFAIFRSIFVCLDLPRPPHRHNVMPDHWTKWKLNKKEEKEVEEHEKTVYDGSIAMGNTVEDAQKAAREAKLAKTKARRTNQKTVMCTKRHIMFIQLNSKDFDRLFLEFFTDKAMKEQKMARAAAKKSGTVTTVATTAGTYIDKDSLPPEANTSYYEKLMDSMNVILANHNFCDIQTAEALPIVDGAKTSGVQAGVI